MYIGMVIELLRFMKKCYSLFLFLVVAFTSSNAFSQTKEEQAIQLYEQKSLKASQQLFQEILAQEPENERAQEYLGSIAFDFQEYEKSAAYVKPLMEKYPTVARFHFKYAGAIGLYAKNNKVKAMFLLDDIKRHFHKAADLDKTFVDARLALVHLYLELPRVLGGSKDKALFYAKQVQDLDVKAGAMAMGLITAAN